MSALSGIVLSAKPCPCCLQRCVAPFDRALRRAVFFERSVFSRDPTAPSPYEHISVAHPPSLSPCKNGSCLPGLAPRFRVDFSSILFTSSVGRIFCLNRYVRIGNFLARRVSTDGKRPERFFGAQNHASFMSFCCRFPRVSFRQKAHLSGRDDIPKCLPVDS